MNTCDYYTTTKHRRLATERYLTAFETGSLDADTCGHRVRHLKIRIQQLTHRRADLEHALNSAPARPSRQAIDCAAS